MLQQNFDCKVLTHISKFDVEPVSRAPKARPMCHERYYYLKYGYTLYNGVARASNKN